MVRIDVFTGDDRRNECCAAILLFVGISWYLDSKCNGVEVTPKEKVAEARSSESFLVREIRHYQEHVSPKLLERYKVVCKFEPTCSEYAIQAIEKYGTVRGSLMAVNRLARCNPWSTGGNDQVR